MCVHYILEIHIFCAPVLIDSAGPEPPNPAALPRVLELARKVLCKCALIICDVSDQRCADVSVLIFQNKNHPIMLTASHFATTSCDKRFCIFHIPTYGV